MNLRDSWGKYKAVEDFNYSDIEEYIRDIGQTRLFNSGKAIVEKNDFLLIFILSLKG
ncbi:hypothetical protein LHA31_04775 [Carnobacterium viridans]|uniref:Uncharacterized protein n=1 Tax=Carnobacterium viridans TaxID=174587 RepID=A0A1H1AV00_9LACT|nr:hypothetical protein [Carnobacterium viridans]UDE96045.1 hypothetical protein LHA31_04775 [Carnobacterium viridans]SDQ43472.1 hypothetical protein SAMN04487752_2268 [Carnobacterium viridans]